MFLGFLGTHTPKLDDKGRLVLPAKFREGFAAGLVLTKGQDRSIVVWPAEEFAAYADRLNEAGRSNPKVQAYQRVLFSGAFDEVPDRQGRITVPPALREYAGLDRDCTVIGAVNRLEIWDTTAWQTYQDAHEDSYAQAQQEVLPGVF